MQEERRLVEKPLAERPTSARSSTVAGVTWSASK
jgi:hypothetical protein